MASLKLKDVSKVYPSGTLALYESNLQTDEKEFIVVVGGEQSGKSTLLRIIAGLDDVSSGQIFIGDKDVTDADGKERNVAIVFRESPLNSSLSVFDNMAYSLKIRKASPAVIEQKVKAAAAVLGLTDMLSRKPKTLTASQRQRVAIGRAIVREPKLYLFDEPLAGLDEKLQGDLLSLIINLQARIDGTFIYATKNLAEALTIGTRIVVLKGGIVQQIDTPRNLYDYPANAYVAFYIGSPTINFVNDAEIIREDGAVFAVKGDFKLRLEDATLARFKPLDEYVGSGKKVNVGIRPEDIKTVKGDSASVVKVMRDKTAVYADVDYCGMPFTVTASADVNTVEKVGVEIDAKRVYLFDGETRLTLLSRDGGYVRTGHADANYKPMPFDEEEKVRERAKPKKAETKKR